MNHDTPIKLVRCIPFYQITEGSVHHFSVIACISVIVRLAVLAGYWTSGINDNSVLLQNVEDFCQLVTLRSLLLDINLLCISAVRIQVNSAFHISESRCKELAANIIKAYLVSNCMSFLQRQRCFTTLSLGSSFVSSEQNILMSFE